MVRRLGKAPGFGVNPDSFQAFYHGSRSQDMVDPPAQVAFEGAGQL
jgi:hypothetical protein